MVKTKKIILVNRVKGFPKVSDFRLVEEELPPLRDGEFLTEALWLSVDPYMRCFLDTVPVGSVMPGGQVARVLESKNPKFPKDSIVAGYFSWQTHAVVNDTTTVLFFELPRVLADFGGLPASLGLGSLGMPGFTAYVGFLQICKPKPGDVVLVNAAAGAVGSIVGQIALVKGCKVIGFAGSDKKVQWLKNELGFHDAFNYKKVTVDEALKIAAPDGIDCFFDNVGGPASNQVIKHMKDFGRVAVCGNVSGYNDRENRPLAPVIWEDVLLHQVRIEGFVFTRWMDQWDEGIQQLLQWIKEGKLKYHESITDGFENLPQAFLGVLSGENIGKAIVKC